MLPFNSWKISVAVIASATLAILVIVTAVHGQDAGQPEVVPAIQEAPQVERDADRLVQLVMDLHVHYCVRDGGVPDDCRRQAQQRANGE